MDVCCRHKNGMDVLVSIADCKERSRGDVRLSPAMPEVNSRLLAFSRL